MTTISDVMTTEVCMVPTDALLTDAARVMRDQDVGDVIVIDDGDQIRGLVTDRDLTIRGIAEGLDPAATRVREVCTSELVTVEPDAEVGEVVRMMREHAVRRIPVVEEGRAIGMVSLGDLARAYDQGSAMADIAEQPPNN